MKKLMYAVSTALILSSSAFAQEAMAPESHWYTPLEIGIASPIQLPPASWIVGGVRLDLFYGDSYELYGIDLGLVGRTRKDFWGIALNGVNWNDGNAYGVQLGALANSSLSSVYGVQLASVVNYVYNEMRGVQLAFVNQNGPFYGLQFGALNWNRGISYGGQIGLVNSDVNEFNGASIGLINYAVRSSGAQIGVVNVSFAGEGLQLGVFNAAESFEGVQIGVLNIIQKGAMPIMCIVNANF